MAGRTPDRDKRARILRAATDVFSAREFHAVPVEDVAAAAHVGKGTLYLYFPTKEQLFYATILEALDALIAELERAVRGRRGEAGLRAFVACVLDFFWRRHHLTVLMQRYEHKQREPEGAEWRVRRERLVAMARALLAPELGGHLAARDAALATEMLLALIRAAVLNRHDRDRPERIADSIVGIFLRGVRGAGARGRRRATPPARRAGGRR